MVISLKGSYVVKPAEQTPNGRMSLSDCDQYKPITHATTVYFYRNSGELVTPAIDILKDSLSKALVMFYPLAGRLYWIEGGRLELDCNSMGALLVEAESEAKMDDLGDFRPTPEIRALIPSVDYNTVAIQEQALLVVQLTKFSCGGMSLGLGMSHVIIDGQSALHFVSEWAKLARADEPLNPPFLDRSILQSEEDGWVEATPGMEHVELAPAPLLIGRADDMEERKKETKVGMLKLSKEQIEKVRRKANNNNKEGPINNGGGGGGGGRGRGYSRYEAVAGHMWRCACKARMLEPQQRTRVYISVDFRNRMEPPLPKHYFGNGYVKAAAEATSGDIVKEPLGYASAKIRQAIQQVRGDFVRSSLAFQRKQSDPSNYRYFHVLGSSKGAFRGNPNLDLTSWVGLPIYGADFGWGKEVHMGPGTVSFDGKSFILPGPDQDGSFLIACRFQVPHMDAFQTSFYQDI